MSDARLLLILSLFLLIPLAVVAQSSKPSDPRAREIASSLNLHVLQGESGWLGIIGDSHQMAAMNGRDLKIQSQVYYMLTRELPINYLHWLASDDTHVLIEGGPVDYYLFCADGSAQKYVLGRDLAHGERPVVAVPGGCWKALRLHAGAGYALMANALSPEWTPDDRVRVGAGPAWVQQWNDKAPWATSEFLRSLIGPNWKP